MAIPELTAKDWFQISGRGWVAAVDLPEPIDRDKILKTYKRVKIDGTEYEVIGFEGWLIHTLKNDVGLLVKGPPRLDAPSPTQES